MHEEDKVVFKFTIDTIIKFLSANLFSGEQKRISKEQREELERVKKIKQRWVDNDQLFKSSPKKFLRKFLDTLYKDLSEEERALKLAIYIRASQGIEPGKMIDILGSPEPFCLLVLKKYISTFKFHNTKLILSLRIFFGNFLMQGESQMIERVLDELSQSYFNENPVELPIYLYFVVYLPLYKS